jgi:hypothetical protein
MFAATVRYLSTAVQNPATRRRKARLGGGDRRHRAPWCIGSLEPMRHNLISGSLFPHSGSAVGEEITLAVHFEDADMMDLSRFGGAPLIAQCAAKEVNHGHRQDG